MPQNFKLQKENGIFIKGFYGEDADDNALIDLIPILTNIVEGDDKDSIDLRKELKKYRNIIFERISSNVEKNEYILEEDQQSN